MNVAGRLILCIANVALMLAVLSGVGCDQNPASSAAQPSVAATVTGPIETPPARFEPVAPEIASDARGDVPDATIPAADTVEVVPATTEAAVACDTGETGEVVQTLGETMQALSEVCQEAIRTRKALMTADLDRRAIKQEPEIPKEP